MRNVCTKLIEKTKTHFVFSFSENRAVYEIMWTNMVKPDRPQMTIWRKRISCWLTKATNTSSKYILPYFSIDNARVIYTKKGLNS